MSWASGAALSPSPFIFFFCLDSSITNLNAASSVAALKMRRAAGSEQAGGRAVGWASSMESCNLPVGVVGLDNWQVAGSLEDSVVKVEGKKIYIFLM